MVHARPIRGGEGATVGVLCSLTDISERRRLRKEVQCARDSREDFLRVLAHELRNPLASVMTVAAILRRQPGELGIVRMARVIEPELLPHVFDLFTQAQRTPDRKHGGLGIGLALVQTLVSLHDGEILVASAGLGQGSTFTVSLPLCRRLRAFDTRPV